MVKKCCRRTSVDNDKLFLKKLRSSNISRLFGDTEVKIESN